MIVDFNSSKQFVKKEQVGNKFYNLFLLKNELHLNVPQAFCITKPNIDEKELIKRIDPNKEYAVRSSSNSEDMSNQSAAGMFKSYLNVKGFASVRQKIKDCFNSIQSEEAQAYLKNKDNDLKEARVAVIIQEMIKPEKAGVLFTVNPVNGTEEIVIEYMSGVAEHLMDGNVIPQRAVFSKPQESKNSFLHDLVNMTAEIENYFKQPQDVEWAYQDKRFFILQARPITTVVSTKRDLSRVWTRANIGEILPRPLTPLSWDVFRKVLFSSYRFGFYGFHDWILTNMIHLIPREFPEIISPQRFNEIAYLNLDTVRVAFSFEPWVSEQILNMGLGFTFNDGEISRNLKLTTWAVKTLKKTLFYIEKVFPFLSMEKRVVKTVSKKLSKMDDLSFEAKLKRVALIFGWHIAVTARSFSFLGYLANKADKGKQKETIADLLLKQDTTEFVVELEKLQQLIKKTSGLKEKIVENGIKDLENHPKFTIFAVQLNSFLDKFGHRSDNEFELLQKDWHENPDQLTDALLREKQDTRENLLASRKKDFKVVNSFRVREELKNLLIAEYRKLRIHLLDLAENFVNKQKLVRAEDVFFLKLEELQEMIKADTVQSNEIAIEIKERRKQFLQFKNENIPFTFITDAQGNVVESAKSEKGSLTGVGCSQGVVSGRAVHVLSLDEGKKLKKGDIMVTSATDPGWTPLFAKVAGVITEIGGMLSHTATIAREFNIPMITGIQNIKTTIPNGKTIEMDGTYGTIKIMEDENN